MPKPAELQLTPGKPMRWMMARSIYVEEVKGALFFFFSLSHSNHHPQQFDEKKRDHHYLLLLMKNQSRCFT